MDTYPSLLKGLVYVSGDFLSRADLLPAELRNTVNMSVDGVVVVGATLTANGTMSLNYRSTYDDNPPPSFTTPVQMVISPGTWRQVVD